MLFLFTLQAILVVNNESREKLPEVLSTGLVLTIFEAKGLEFDDVLLYNFFKDSQVCHYQLYFCNNFQFIFCKLIEIDLFLC